MARCVVESNQPLGPNFHLVTLDTNSEFPYLAGQTVSVTVPPQKGSQSSAPSQAVYSIASEERKASLELLVEKRGGWRAEWMCGLSRGDTVEVAKASGAFELNHAQSRDQVFMGFGAGIGPLRSMINTLLIPGLSTQMYLFMGSQDSDSLLFTQELEQLASQQPRFQYQSCGKDPAGAAVTAIPDLNSCDFYLAGFDQEVDAMYGILKAAGCSDSRIQQSKFG
jgi:ferredoxin-NADP reductase